MKITLEFSVFTFTFFFRAVMAYTVFFIVAFSWAVSTVS